jgi:hypothetical protein
MNTVPPGRCETQLSRGMQMALPEWICEQSLVYLP